MRGRRPWPPDAGHGIEVPVGARVERRRGTTEEDHVSPEGSSADSTSARTCSGWACSTAAAAGASRSTGRSTDPRKRSSTRSQLPAPSSSTRASAARPVSRDTAARPARTLRQTTSAAPIDLSRWNRQASRAARGCRTSSLTRRVPASRPRHACGAPTGTTGHPDVSRQERRSAADRCAVRRDAMHRNLGTAPQKGRHARASVVESSAAHRVRHGADPCGSAPSRSSGRVVLSVCSVGETGGCSGGPPHDGQRPGLRTRGPHRAQRLLAHQQGRPGDARRDRRAHPCPVAGRHRPRAHRGPRC